MNARGTRKIRKASLFGAVLTLSFAVCTLQADNKPKASAPAAKPAAPAAKPGGAAPAGHGPAAPGGAAHGPTTTTGGAGKTTTGSGITTGNRTGAATTTGTHGPTTSNPAGTRTGASPTTANPAGTRTGAPAAGAGPKPGGTSQAASSSMPHTASGAPPKGSTMHTTPAGDQVRTRPGGQPGDVHVASRGMDIHHNLSGGRSVTVERADHTRIVAERGGRGYVSHPYAWHGHEWGHRTYWEHGRYYDRFYARYPYHGVFVEMYTPAYYYPPAFYGWAYNPWAVPVAYPIAAWGWAGVPWYGFYGAYFAPYPVYASAYFWLTDYFVAATLQAAYQANAAAAAQAQAQMAADAVAMSQPVKDLIASEVQRQIAIENAESGQQAAGPNPAISGVQRLLSDNQSHVFVAGRPLDVVDSNGTECAVSEGDVLQLTPTPLAPDATAATLVMLTTKGGVECKKGAAVTVAITDLQDMQNHMREMIGQGMGDLKAKQGQNGLPVIPASASGMPMMAQFAMDAPPPDQTASQQITQQAQEADQAEQQVLAQSGTAPANPPPPVAPPPPPPVVIALGQTVDQVVASMGEPTERVEVGPKKIYVYKNIKVTFKDGKVSNVE